jgi:hypothetical protein
MALLLTCPYLVPHPALTARSLDLVASLLPDARAALDRYFPADKTSDPGSKPVGDLTDMERVAKEYREHGAELRAKLVAVLQERVDVCTRALRTQDWSEQGPPKPLAALVADVAALHRSLQPLLPAGQLRAVCMDCGKGLVKAFTELFTSLDVPNPAHRKKLLKDSTFLLQVRRRVLCFVFTPVLEHRGYRPRPVGWRWAAAADPRALSHPRRALVPSREPRTTQHAIWTPLRPHALHYDGRRWQPATWANPPLRL